MSASTDREQLKRATVPMRSRPSNWDQRTDPIAELAESLPALGPPYRLHGELMPGALRDGQDNAVTWHLIHVLAGLEKEA